MSFRLLGVTVKIEFVFTATVALLALIDKQGIMWLSFTAVLLHELGHIVAMLALGVKIRLIRLACCGVIIAADSRSSYIKSAIIALSGPLVNLVLYLLFPRSAFGNVMLLTGAFNLITVTGTDGGAVLKIICIQLFGLKVSEIVLFVISLLLSLGFSAVGIIILIKLYNPTMLFASLYFLTMAFASLIQV